MNLSQSLKFKALAGAGALALLCLPQVCFAQDSEGDSDTGGHWTVGVGVYGVSSPYDKDDKNQGVFPYIAYNNSWLSVDPSGMAVKAFSVNGCKVEALAAPRFLLSEPGDVARYADMDRGVGLDLGARVGCDFGSGFGAKLAYKADVVSESNGHEIDLSLSKNFQVTDNVNVSMKAGTYWRDNDLSRYLYGVYQDEVRPGRPAYAPGDTYVPYAGLNVAWDMTSHLTLAASFDTEVFTKKIKNSPIIDTEAVGAGTLFLFYRF